MLYFGDFDPSGEDMHRSLIDRWDFFSCYPKVIKVALTAEDIRRYNLPPDFAKTTDSRAAGFIAKHGNVSVELDALPVGVLRTRITTEVESRLDLDALQAVKKIEKTERAKIVELLASV